MGIDGAILLIRLVLSATFLLAGMAKFVEFDNARESIHGFGIPHSIARPFLIGLIIAETATAFLFVFVGTTYLASMIAAILLIGFSIVIAGLVKKGKEVECHCFGAVSQRKVGVRELVRNLLLFVLALLILLAPSPGLDIAGGSDGLSLLEMLKAGVVFALFGLLGALVVLGLDVRRSNRELAMRMSHIEKASLMTRESSIAASGEIGLPVGSVAPDFIVTDAAGNEHRSPELFERNRIKLIVFVGPDCVSCSSISGDLAKWQADLGGDVDVVILTSGSVEENLKKFGEMDREALYFQKDREVSEKFLARWTPAAFAVDAVGRIASNTVIGDAGIRTLVRQLTEIDQFPANSWYGIEDDKTDSAFGQKMPDLDLEFVNGAKFSTAQLRGRETIALFWSLTCGFCTELIPEIEAWSKENNDYQLAVFADGSVKELKATGLGDVLIYDPGFRFAESIGKRGTPSAVRLDQEGVVISETASGAHRIGMLAGREISGVK